MAQARTDGAPTGTSYQCYVCGYDTRIDPVTGEKGSQSRGVYTEKIGVRHPTTSECMKLINHFIDYKLDLQRPHHREDVNA